MEKVSVMKRSYERAQSYRKKEYDGGWDGLIKDWLVMNKSEPYVV